MGQCLSSLLTSPQAQEVVNEVLGIPTAGGTSSTAASPTVPDESSPLLVHAALPSDAVAAVVRNVYDGDTLTLTDDRRVRLVGIDAPEIKEHHPYAQEAKAYTKHHCFDNNQQRIWISSADSSHNHNQQVDHYGRILALVWVKAASGSGYLCINEGIVAAGLARVYRPSTTTKISNWNRLLQLQASACQQKLGLWKNFQDTNVFKTSHGSAYHKASCQHIESSNNLTTIKISAALEQGLHPCRTCLGGG